MDRFIDHYFLKDNYEKVDNVLNNFKYTTLTHKYPNNFELHMKHRMIKPLFVKYFTRLYGGQYPELSSTLDPYSAEVLFCKKYITSCKDICNKKNMNIDYVDLYKSDQLIRFYKEALGFAIGFDFKTMEYCMGKYTVSYMEKPLGEPMCFMILYDGDKFNHIIGGIDYDHIVRDLRNPITGDSMSEKILRNVQLILYKLTIEELNKMSFHTHTGTYINKDNSVIFHDTELPNEFPKPKMLLKTNNNLPTDEELTQFRNMEGIEAVIIKIRLNNYPHYSKQNKDSPDSFHIEYKTNQFVVKRACSKKSTFENFDEKLKSLNDSYMHISDDKLAEYVEQFSS